MTPTPEHELVRDLGWVERRRAGARVSGAEPDRREDFADTDYLDDDELVERLSGGEWAAVWAGTTTALVGLAALIGAAGRHWGWW